MEQTARSKSPDARNAEVALPRDLLNFSADLIHNSEPDDSFAARTRSDSTCKLTRPQRARNCQSLISRERKTADH